jgi:hypothetical protein
MAMLKMKTTIALLLMATACGGSEVDLELELEKPDSPEDPPADETPGSPDSAGNAVLGNLSALRTMPGAGQSRVDQVEWDEDGSLLVRGSARGPTDLGDGKSHGGEDSHISFVGRYPSDGGAPSWLQLVGVEDGQTRFSDVHPVGGGALMASGDFEGVLELDPSQDVGDCRSGFLARFEADGSVGSVQVLRGLLIHDFVPLPDGGATVTATDQECDDGFEFRTQVSRLDLAGQPLWTLDLGELTWAEVNSAPGGGILLSGLLGGEVAEGELTDTYVAQVSLEGEVLWSIGFHSDVEAATEDLQVSEDGQIFVTGEFRSIFEVGSFTFDAGPDLEFGMFMAELDPTGQVVDARQLEGSGGFGRALSLGGDQLAVAGESGISGGDLGGQKVFGGFAGIFDASGEIVETHSLNAPADEDSLAVTGDIAFGPDGAIALVGHFKGVADFGDGPVETDTGPEASDAYIAVYRPEPAGGVD